MSKQPASRNLPLAGVCPLDPSSGVCNVIIETPQGSRNKFKYNEELGLFELSGVLPAGASFPYDFGFLPGTRGEDGDPLDVLVLMDEPVFPGCLVSVRLIGVIEAEQTEEEGKTERNDRLVAVYTKSHIHRSVTSLDELGAEVLHEIEHFFKSYNNARGRVFAPIGRHGPEEARKLVEEGMKSVGRSMSNGSSGRKGGKKESGRKGGSKGSGTKKGASKSKR